MSQDMWVAWAMGATFLAAIAVAVAICSWTENTGSITPGRWKR